MKHSLLLACLAGVLACVPITVCGQAVVVTLRLDTNMIALGGLTTLHVEARISPALRDTADRIFSWYVDVLNTNGNVARANYAALQKPTSDNQPMTSSSGMTEGNHRRGIHDTFLNRPAAGRDAIIELMSIPVSGVTPGQTRFRVQAGTGQAGLTADFYVVPLDGGEPGVGGHYGNAFVDLRVSSEMAPPRLAISQTIIGGGLKRVAIQYAVNPQQDHFLQVRPSWGVGSDWQALPGGPFNSGLYVETNNVSSRFYRVLLQPR